MTETLLYAIAIGSPLVSAAVLVQAKLQWRIARKRYERHADEDGRLISAEREYSDRLFSECDRIMRERDQFRNKLAQAIAAQDAQRQRLSEAGRKGALIGNKSPKRKRG